jgi:hypothetical protein
MIHSLGVAIACEGVRDDPRVLCAERGHHTAERSTLGFLHSCHWYCGKNKIHPFQFTFGTKFSCIHACVKPNLLSENPQIKRLLLIHVSGAFSGVATNPEWWRAGKLSICSAPQFTYSLTEE